MERFDVCKGCGRTSCMGNQPITEQTDRYRTKFTCRTKSENIVVGRKPDAMYVGYGYKKFPLDY